MLQNRRRWGLIIVACFLALVGLGTMVSWIIFPYMTLRLAAGPIGSDGQKFHAIFVRAWTDAHPHIRLKVVPTSDAAASAKALETGKVDLAVMRSDLLANTKAQTIAILRRDVVGFLVPSQAAIDEVRKLAGKTLGMVPGTPADERLLEQILDYYQLPAKTMPHVVLAAGEIGPALRSKRVAAIFALGPVGAGPLAEAVMAVAKAGKGAPDILAIEAAEAIARGFPCLEETEIAPGAFGGNPLRPEESVTTLAVTLRLVARPSLSNYVAGEITRLLFTTKSQLAATFPHVSHIEAPDTDKGAALPVHPGAAAYLNGELGSLLERFESVLYLGTIVVSLLGSGLAWLMSAWQASQPRQDQAQAERLLAIFREAPVASPDELDTLAQEVEEICAWALERAVYGALKADRFQLMALSVTQARYAIDTRRRRLC